MSRRRMAKQQAALRQQRRAAQIDGQVQKRQQQLQNTTLIEYGVGDWVKVRVPKGDRSSVGPCLLTMLVVQRNDGTGMYRLATQDGILNVMVDSPQIYKKSQSEGAGGAAVMEAWTQGIMKKLPLRSLCKKADPFGGQGKNKCGCKKGCKGGRCACRAARRECNSSCHCNLLGNCHNSSAFPERRVPLAAEEAEEAS